MHFMRRSGGHVMTTKLAPNMIWYRINPFLTRVLAEMGTLLPIFPCASCINCILEMILFAFYYEGWETCGAHRVVLGPNMIQRFPKK